MLAFAGMMSNSILPTAKKPYYSGNMFASNIIYLSVQNLPFYTCAFPCWFVEIYHFMCFALLVC